MQIRLRQISLQTHWANRIHLISILNWWQASLVDAHEYGTRRQSIILTQLGSTRQLKRRQIVAPHNLQSTESRFAAVWNPTQNWHKAKSEILLGKRILQQVVKSYHMPLWNTIMTFNWDSDWQDNQKVTGSKSWVSLRARKTIITLLIEMLLAKRQQCLSFRQRTSKDATCREEDGINNM